MGSNSNYEISGSEAAYKNLRKECDRLKSCLDKANVKIKKANVKIKRLKQLRKAHHELHSDDLNELRAEIRKIKVKGDDRK